MAEAIEPGIAAAVEQAGELAAKLVDRRAETEALRSLP